MVKSGSLFYLIKSLNKNEKRYFKIFATINKENANYLQLFEAIDAQSVYDEKSIKDAFKGKTFIKQLHVSKIYLSDLILKSLRNYNSNASITAQILDLIKDIEILFGKELYNASYLKTIKAEKIALKYEKFSLLIEILAWKRKLGILFQTDSGIIEETNALERLSIEKLSEINQLWLQTIRIFQFTDLTVEIKNIQKKKPSSLLSEVLKKHLLFTYYFMSANYTKAHSEITELINTLESKPERISDDPGMYVTALSNKISLLINQNNRKQTESLIKIMREVPLKYKLNTSNQYTVKLWLRIFNLELEIYRDTQQWKKGTALIKEAELYIQSHHMNVNDNYKIMLYYQFASIYFHTSNYSKSLYWVNSILNTKFGNIRTDIQCYARILNLMVHFELKNVVLLRYASESCARFIKKNKKITPIEQNILKMFHNLAQAPEESYPDILNKSYKEMFLNKNQELELKDYLDLESWLKEKINP